MPYIVWSKRSSSNISRLLAYHEDNPAMIEKALDTITSGVMLLLRFPRSGRPIASPEGERRELVLPYGRGAYILRYQIDGDAITVIAVRHSSVPGS